MLRIGLRGLQMRDVVDVARDGYGVSLSEEAAQRMRKARAIVEDHMRGGKPVYGLNTGFGALAGVAVPDERNVALQHNLVRSHAAGAGDSLPDEVVRAMMLIRAKNLASGYSGVRPEVAEALLALLNCGAIPVVPSRGSVGASGDLAPLAHIALTLLGEGTLKHQGQCEDSATVLKRLGIEPLELQAKEGLSLINGTDGMLALGCLAHEDATLLAKTADIAAACTIEAAFGTPRPFISELQRLRPHAGQASSASAMSAILTNSEIVDHHAESDHVVQDPYSMRCAPQVHGAVRDVIGFVGNSMSIELSGAIDNPAVLPDGRVESNGNFHGESLAYALDFLAISLAGLANIAERRTLWLLNFGTERGLPHFLATDAGVESGHMLVQYTQAALLTELKMLATPASVDSIPTSGSQEDHVSMGWLSGLKVRNSLDLVSTILGIEILCATHGLDARAPLKPAPVTAAVRSLVRQSIDRIEGDRSLAPDIAEMQQLVTSGAVLAAAEEALGAEL